MSYQSWSVVFGEQPSAAKWNILGQNDASFNDGSGIDDGVITPEHMNFGAQTAIVNTTETTTATSPADLATVGPEVTVTVPSSGCIFVSFAAKGSEDGSSRANTGVALSGANTLGADNEASHIAHGYWPTGNNGEIGRSFLMTGLTPGSTTFTMKYWGITGIKTFLNRIISVIPIGD